MSMWTSKTLCNVICYFSCEDFRRFVWLKAKLNVANPNLINNVIEMPCRNGNKDICPPIFSFNVHQFGWRMWSPLIEDGSDNLALLHCSCLHACLAAYSNISRRDLNNSCITVNHGMWRHGRGPINGRSDELEGFWSKPSIKRGDKNHIKCG